MTKEHCVAILLIITLSGSYAESEMDYINSDDVHEGSPCEFKISVALSAIKYENDRRLNAMDMKIQEIMDNLEKKLPERLEKYMENNFSTLKKINQDTQEVVDDKLRKLELKLLEKFEKYTDMKITSLENHFNKKIDSFQSALPDIIDIDSIKFKLDSLKRLQLESSVSSACVIENKTLIKWEERLHKSLNTIDMSIFVLKNTTVNNFNDLDKKLTIFNNSSQYYTGVQTQFDIMERNIINIEKNIQNKLNVLDKKIDQSLNHTLVKKQEETTKNISQTKSITQNLQDNIIARDTNYKFGCQEYSARGKNESPYHWVAQESLRYSHMFDMEKGFYMYVAVKGTAKILISTVPVTNTDFEIGEIYKIVISPNRIELLRSKHTVSVVDMGPPAYDYLHNTYPFVAYYVSVHGDTLQIWNSPDYPIMTFSKWDLTLARHIAVSSDGNESEILFDCPPDVRDSIHGY